MTSYWVTIFGAEAVPVALVYERRNRSVARVCLHCCNSDQLWPLPDLGVSGLKKLQTNWLKIGVGDYVGDITSHAKFQNDRPIGGVPAYGRSFLT